MLSSVLTTQPRSICLMRTECILLTGEFLLPLAAGLQEGHPGDVPDGIRGNQLIGQPVSQLHIFIHQRIEVAHLLGNKILV